MDIPTRVKIAAGPLKDRLFLRSDPSFEQYTTGHYEMATQGMLAMVLRPGGVFFDIGAHHGFFALLGATLVGPKGRVAAFEPDPVNAQLIKDNLAANHLSRRVTIVPKAVSDQDGEAEFVTVKTNSDLGHLADGPVPLGWDLTRVRTVTLDTFRLEGNYRPPTVVKVDCEGAEDRVLRGATLMLNLWSPILIIAAHGPSKLATCVATLGDAGYTSIASDEILFCWKIR